MPQDLRSGTTRAATSYHQRLLDPAPLTNQKRVNPHGAGLLSIKYHARSLSLPGMTCTFQQLLGIVDLHERDTGGNASTRDNHGVTSRLERGDKDCVLAVGGERKGADARGGRNDVLGSE